MKSVNTPAQACTPKKARASERQARALELRKMGRNYRQIAEELGYASASGAKKAVLAGIKWLLYEDAKDVLAIELDRLDTYLNVIWPQILEGDLGAIDRALKIGNARETLLELVQPRGASVRVKQGDSTITVSFSGNIDPNEL